MDKQYKRQEKTEYMRMESKEFIAWCPNAGFIDHDSVEDVGYGLLNRDQQRDYALLKDSEQSAMANNSAREANLIIERLMKGAK